MDGGGGLFGTPEKPTTLDISADHPDARLVRAGSHPRLKVLIRGLSGSEEKGPGLAQVISIKRVRKLKEFFQLSAADGGRRVVIIDAADELNVQAANALLKELEEPPANTTLLLVAHQPSRLLPTIRSRCRTLRCDRLTAPAMAEALAQAGHPLAEAEALRALADGSVGTAIQLLNDDGLAIYAALVKLLSGLPQVDRPALLQMANACTGKSGAVRFGLTLDLVDRFLARTARAGLQGEPQVQGAPGEARLLARLAPDAAAARRWAALQQDLSARSRHGRAVNLDPASLILDMVFRIEETAQGVAAS
jgi:DNA polymerase-3 subunit delta'